jgi:hypothetical protein
MIWRRPSRIARTRKKIIRAANGASLGAWGACAPIHRNANVLQEKSSPEDRPIARFGRLFSMRIGEDA